MMLNISSVNCPDQSSKAYYTTITIVACSFNAILFKLIRNYTHPLMKPYLRILYSSVCLDFFSAIFQFLSQARPSVLGPNKVFTVSLDGILPRIAAKYDFFNGGNLNYALILEYWGCYIVIAYCWLPFIFRYLIICWEYHMSRRVFTVCIVSICSISLLEAVLITHLSARAYDKNVNYVPKPDPKCIRFLPQMDYMLNLDNLYDRVIFKVWYHICYSFLQATYLVIIFCAWRIYRFFKTHASLYQTAAQNTRIQFQITATLCAQTIIPAIIYFGPIFIMMFLYRNEAFTNLYYKIMYSGYSIIPVVNPLLSMLLITNYRRSLLAFICKTVVRLPGVTFDLVHNSSIAPEESSPNISNLTIL